MLAWIWGLLLAISILLVVFYIRFGGVLKSILFTASGGTGLLGVLWLLSKFIAVPVAITPLSIAISAVLGIPGVITILIINLI